MISIGLGVAVLILVPEKKIIAAAVLGVGLPIGMVLSVVGLAQSGLLSPRS